METVFQIIRKMGPLYNHEIVRESGLVKSTVSISVAELINMGLVEEAPMYQKRRPLRLAEDYGTVAGLYMGLSSLNIALCDLSGNIIEDFQSGLDLTAQTPEEITAIIIDALASFDAKDLLGIGMGLPGPVDFQNGSLFAPPEMPGWDQYPICRILEERFQCMVMLDNDVNVLALGEKEKGSAKGIPHFLYIKVGTGIGAGLVVNGDIYRGSNGAAGDIGHIAIDGDTTLCPCGNRGCLEMVAASRGIVREALLVKNSSPYLSRFDDSSITAALVGQGMGAGDLCCTQIIIKSGKAVGSVAAKLVNFFNPGLIVIGGGIAESGQKFISSIQEVLYQRSTPLATSGITVKKTDLGDTAGTIGAAFMVLDKIFENIQDQTVFSKTAR